MRSCTWRRFVFLDVIVSIKSVLGRSSLVVGQNQEPRLSTSTELLQNRFGFGQRRTANDQRRLLRSGLSYLLLQAFSGIADAFVFVWIWWAQAAHFCCYLTYLLAIDSGDS